MSSQHIARLFGHQPGAPVEFGPFERMDPAPGKEVEQQMELAVRLIQGEARGRFHGGRGVTERHHVSKPGLGGAPRRD